MFGNLKRGYKWLRLLMKVEKIWKENMTMDDKPILKSWVNIGAIALALVPISALILPAIGLGEFVGPVAKILAGIAAFFGVVGARRLAGKAIMVNGKR
jgi:hypothetical protein